MGFEEMIVRTLNWRRRRRAPAPRGLCLGEAETILGGERTGLRLPVQPVQHSFICGRTGSGKTTLLLRMMDEHVRMNVPLAFIDFHGPATDDLLAMIASRGTPQPVVLLEPWSDPVIGWNPLETNGEYPYATVQELVSIFHRRLWPDAWGPRLEELLRMTLLALAEARLTLLEATAFLSRAEFRREVLRQVSLPEVREFWVLRFERLSPSQRSLVTEAVLNKISVFHDPVLKYVVGQQHAALDFDRALKEGHTIIANLSSGAMRGNNFLLAALLVAKLKAAVYRRVPGAPPYAVVLDECQELLPIEMLDDYLRSFRKFGCMVYLATQHLALPPELKAGIFGNCSRFFCFATSANDAAFLAKEFGSADGELAAGLLPELRTGQAIVKVRGEPVRLLRVPPSPVRATPALVAAGRERCVRLGKSRRQIDEEISRRSGGLASVSGTQSKPDGVCSEVDDADGLPEGYE